MTNVHNKSEYDKKVCSNKLHTPATLELQLLNTHQFLLCNFFVFPQLKSYIEKIIHVQLTEDIHTQILELLTGPSQKDVPSSDIYNLLHIKKKNLKIEEAIIDWTTAVGRSNCHHWQ